MKWQAGRSPKPVSVGWEFIASLWGWWSQLITTNVLVICCRLFFLCMFLLCNKHNLSRVSLPWKLRVDAMESFKEKYIHSLVVTAVSKPKSEPWKRVLASSSKNNMPSIIMIWAHQKEILLSDVLSCYKVVHEFNKKLFHLLQCKWLPTISRQTNAYCLILTCLHRSSLFDF